MKSRISRLAMVAMVALATFDQVQAAVISQWSLNNTTNDGLLPGGTDNFGPSPFNPTLKDSNVTVGGWRRGSGVASRGTGAASGWGGTGWSRSDLAAAAGASQFVRLTAKANAGFELSLSDIAAYNVRRSSSSPTTGQWQYSTNGTTFTNIGSAITWGSNGTSSGNSQSLISLSGITALQNVPDTTTVTFRVVNWGASSVSGAWYFNGAGSTAEEQFLTVNGAVAVPEPSTYAIILAGLACCGYVVFRRCKRALHRTGQRDSNARGAGRHQGPAPLCVFPRASLRSHHSPYPTATARFRPRIHPSPVRRQKSTGSPLA